MTIVLPEAVASMPPRERAAYRLAVMRGADAARLAELEAALGRGIDLESLALVVFASGIGEPFEDSPGVRASIAALGFPEDELAAFFAMRQVAAAHTPESMRA